MSAYPICKRCKREAHGWPLERGGDKCSPKRWVHCLRDPFVVIAENAKESQR